MKILLTNDDGFEAPGLRALAQALLPEHQCWIVAPKDERSASSHAISLGQKLRVERHSLGKLQAFAVHGTPADCIKFALYELTGFKPDLIFSGINQGANTGVSVYYSGTLSAAREGMINRIPAAAFSLCSRTFHDFSGAQAVARRVAEAYQNRIFPPDVLLNINIPPLTETGLKGIRITKQADSRFVEEFVPEKKHGEVDVYTLAGEIELLEPDGTSDEEAVMGGWVSLTPLKLDLTDYESMPFFKKWAGNGKSGGD